MEDKKDADMQSAADKKSAANTNKTLIPEPRKVECCCCDCKCSDEATLEETCCICCPIKCGIHVIAVVTFLLAFYLLMSAMT